MFVNVKKMPVHEILPLMQKLEKAVNDSNCAVSHDDEDDIWYVNINWDNDRSDWKMTSHGKGRLSMYEIWVEYYPPKGGNLRFDFCVSCVSKNEVFANIPDEEIKEVLRIYTMFVTKFGHAGKDSVSCFEQL